MKEEVSLKEENTMNKCIGCGKKLQNKDASKDGYTPLIDAKYCQRCFKLTHYGISEKLQEPKSAEKIIDHINNNRCY